MVDTEVRMGAGMDPATGWKTDQKPEAGRREKIRDCHKRPPRSSVESIAASAAADCPSIFSHLLGLRTQFRLTVPYYGIPTHGIIQPGGDPEFRRPEGRPLLSRGAASQGRGLDRRCPGHLAEAGHARLRASTSRSGSATRQPIGGVEGRARRFAQHPDQRPMAGHLSMDRLRAHRCRHR